MDITVDSIVNGWEFFIDVAIGDRVLRHRLPVTTNDRHEAWRLAGATYGSIREAHAADGFPRRVVGTRYKDGAIFHGPYMLSAYGNARWSSMSGGEPLEVKLAPEAQG